MTPEEKAALKEEITTSTTKAVLEALAKRDADAEAKADAEVEATAKADAAAKAKADAEVATIEFEGDMENPEDVQAHLTKVQMAKLKADADLNTPEGIVAYQESLATIQGTKAAPEARGAHTNSSFDEGVLGAQGETYSQEQIDKTVASMTS